MALPLTVSHADNEILYLKTKASSSGGPINVLGLPSSAVLRDVTAPPPRSVEFATRANFDRSKVGPGSAKFLYVIVF